MKSQSSGYSLIELLIVLVIMGLVAGIVLPNMARLYDSYKMSAQWSDIRDQINGLGARAYQENRPYQLAGTEAIADVLIFSLQLPSGWQYQVNTPIKFKSNGACSGGELRFFYNDNLYDTQQLTPPHCQVPL